MEITDFFCERCDKAYIVFVDNVSLWWLRFLKSGFRHCYLLFSLSGGKIWIEINPYSNQTIVQFYMFDEAYAYDSFVVESKKSIVCEVLIKAAPQKCAPFGFFTCVEMIKRVLGMHTYRVITPYQLYKKLKIVGKKS